MTVENCQPKTADDFGNAKRKKHLWMLSLIGRRLQIHGRMTKMFTRRSDDE